MARRACYRDNTAVEHHCKSAQTGQSGRLLDYQLESLGWARRRLRRNISNKPLIRRGSGQKANSKDLRISSTLIIPWSHSHATTAQIIAR